MTLENIIKLLLAGASLCLGSYLTALRSKITTQKVKNGLHFAFYAVTIVFFIVAIYVSYDYWDELLYQGNEISPDYFSIAIILACLISSILLFVFTKNNLVGKNQYRTSELDPVVNKFTKNADKKNIRLLAGDINFFGDKPDKIESNSQYKCLKDEKFREIQILCWRPKNNDEKIRYGKILNDLPQIRLRFYRPTTADLSIRGRIKTLNNVVNVLIYNKVQSGVYETIFTDMASSNGTMYNHLWGLIWDLAEEPSEQDLAEYLNLYRS